MKGSWHLWVVGLLALIWNGLGGLDHVMTQVEGDAWLANMDPTEVQMAWFHAMPAWVDVVWGVGAWSGLLGAVLLLLRRRWALPAFGASLIGWTAYAVYVLGLSNGLAAMGAFWPMLVVHVAAPVLCAWYASIQSRTGVLR